MSFAKLEHQSCKWVVGFRCGASQRLHPLKANRLLLGDELFQTGQLESPKEIDASQKLEANVAEVACAKRGPVRG